MKHILIFFGMTASGKSTLASAWSAEYRGMYYNTDRVRKELAGISPTDRLPDQVNQGIYSAAYTEKTYQTMLALARKDFEDGQTMVVLDGSYGKRQDRDHVRRLAAEIGAQCFFIFCSCSEMEIRRRLHLRANDPQAVSDGRWEIYLHQKATFELPGTDEGKDWLHLNTEQGIGEMVKYLANQLSLRDTSL